MPEHDYVITETVTYEVEASSMREALDKVFNQPNGTVTYFSEAEERDIDGPVTDVDKCRKCGEEIDIDSLLQDDYVYCGGDECLVEPKT